MSFTAEEIQQLAERAKGRPRLARRLKTYVRHVQRIRTLTRVLDPEDTAAVAVNGTPESYQLELERRRGEASALEPHLRAALGRVEA